MGNVPVVVVSDVVVMPVISPVVPPPPEPAKEPDSEAQAKCNPGSGKEQTGIGIPAWPDHNRRSIDQPGIVFRHINDLRIGRFDDNGLPLLGYGFLRCAI